MFIRVNRGILLLAACFMILAQGCSGKRGSSLQGRPLPAGADMVLSEGVHFVEIINGELAWNIRSKRATYSTGTGLLNFYDVQATYFREGRPLYKVSGKEGRYDSKKEEIYLAGNVFGSTADGYTLKTHSLQYKIETEVAETPDYVEIRGKGLEIDGVGMTADFKTEVFKILDGTRVRAAPAEVPR